MTSFRQATKVGGDCQGHLGQSSSQDVLAHHNYKSVSIADYNEHKVAEQRAKESVPPYSGMYHDHYCDKANEPIFKSTYAQSLLKDRNTSS